MRLYVILAVVSAALSTLFSPAVHAAGWKDAKNVADDVIYQGVTRTFYCGCMFTSHGDADGSGDVDHAACGYVGPNVHAHRAHRVEWEHIVPASLMPARQFDCWVNGNRQTCEREDPRAQAMIFDLHNLAPSIGQVNALRGNDRYRDLPDDTSTFGACPIEDAADAFEPPDCLKGDVARVWFYMGLRHGVEIPDDERAMFQGWSAGDPVSAWEFEREKRIAKYTFVINPFVHGKTPDSAGACPWE